MLYRQDYAAAGFPMPPVTESDGLITARQLALYGLTLVPISLVPSLVGLAGHGYFYGALALSGAFLLVAMRAAWVRSPATARALFVTSVLYLPMLLGLLAVDRMPT